MSKLYVSSRPSTSLDTVREALDRAEGAVSNSSQVGSQALQLLHLFDQIEEELQELEQRDVDVRVERTRFETVQRRLKRHKGRFLREVGRALPREREEIEPARFRWWWYLDEAARRQRLRRVLRVVAGTVAVVALLAGAWLAYDQFLAPPPELSMALRRIEAGMSHVEQADLRAALADFDEATTLTPEDTEPWLWKGVLHDQLGEPSESEDAFRTAQSLYGTTLDFVLNRGRVYLQAGNAEKARADVKAALELDPTSGWGYYLRAGIAVREADYDAALADLERAVELAQESGDRQLQTMAATQLTELMKIQPIPTVK